MDKENLEYIHTVECDCYKKGNPAIHNNMDGTWGHYAKWNESEKDKYCMISHVESKKVKLIEAE